MPPTKQGVIAVLQDERGRYLFIRRGWTLSRAPGVWCFVGGQVEDGEGLKEALAREVREEVGLDVAVGEKVHESLSPNGEFRLHWLRARLSPGASGGPGGPGGPGGQEARKLRPHPKEVAGFCWLPAAEGLRLEPILPTLRAWLAQEAGESS